MAQRVSAITGASVIGAGAFFVAYFNPVTAGFFPTCPFHALTRLNCPGCGLTRGFHALFHGEVLEALRFNLLTPFFAAFFSYLLISMIVYSIRGRGLSFRFFPLWTLYAFLILTLVFAITRNLPFYPFNWLAI